MNRAGKRVAVVPVCNYFTSDNRVLRTCQFLTKNGFDVHVLAIGRADLPEDERVEGATVHRYRSSSTKTIRRGVNLTAVRAFRAYIAGCARFVLRHKPDVIHYNDWNTLFLGATAFTGVKHRAIYDMHELFQDLDYLNFPKPINQTIAMIDRVGLRRADAVICVSNPIADELRALTDKPVYVVRNVPDARLVDGNGNAARIAHLSDGRKHLVFLGALQKQKGALDMLRLLAALPSEYVLDCFAGVTDKNAFFVDEAKRLGVTDRVFIFEYLPQHELMATIHHAYAGLSFFVPTSRIYDYALPNKIFEYFLAGIPVVTSNARAQADLVNETGLGVVVDLADPAGSAKRIASWDAPRVTPELVEKHRLTWEHEERALERVYRDLGIV